MTRSQNRYAAYLAYFVLSLGMTGLGFFVEQVPFAIAYIPLGLAICHRHRTHIFWLVCGHYAWVAVISGWGLHQLGYNPEVAVPAVTVALVLGALAMAWLGIGLSAALLCLIPFFPANPLLVTGAVFPEFGIWGIALLLIFIIAAERLKSSKARVGILVGVLILGQTPFVLRSLNHEYRQAVSEHRKGSASTDMYTEIDISNHKAITRSGQWVQIAQVIENRSTVIFGENIFDHTDAGASTYWCRIAKEKAATLYIGVRGKNGVGEVWEFDGRDCAVPSVAYRAVVGIPKITGGWLPNHAEVQSTFSGQQWLACFEGFSMYRWLRAYMTGAKSVVIVSNDRLTQPIPTAVLRRKVGAQFAKLFGLTVAHADTGHNIITVERN
jgi:hypothetical protein